MDEFTGIAVWILAIFLAVNVTVVFFQSSTDMNSNGMNMAFDKPDQFTTSDLNQVQASSTQTCSLAADRILDYIPCEIGKVLAPLTGLLRGLWTFATSWVDLIKAIVAPLPEGATLFANILIPILGLIQITAILVLMMRFAGIIRGGS